jgi:hypothetical protein
MVEKLRGAESYRGASVLSWIQFLLIRNGRCDVRSKSPLAVPWKTCKWLMRVSFHVVSQEVLFMLFAASASVGIFGHPQVQKDTHCKSTYMSVSSRQVCSQDWRLSIFAQISYSRIHVSMLRRSLLQGK